MKHQKLETTESISKRMANVSLKGGKAETDLAKALWHEGIRYRKNYRKIPGSPDIAITKYKIAVFVDGEFWHGENWEENQQAREQDQRAVDPVRKRLPERHAGLPGFGGNGCLHCGHLNSA